MVSHVVAKVEAETFLSYVVPLVKAESVQEVHERLPGMLSVPFPLHQELQPPLFVESVFEDLVYLPLIHCGFKLLFCRCEVEKFLGLI